MTAILSHTDRQLLTEVRDLLKEQSQKTVWISIGEVRRALGGPDKNRMERWRRTGAIRYKREGGKILYDADSVNTLKKLIA